MRRLLVILGLLATGTAAISLPDDPGPGGPGPDGQAPPAVGALLGTVRSVVDPVAPPSPPGVAVLPAPDTPGTAAPGQAAPEVPALPAGGPGASDPVGAQAAPKRSGAEAPARCEAITVVASAAPASVAPGGRSTLTIMVANPNNRPLSRVSLVERLTAEEARFSVASTNPPADSVKPGSVVYDNLGRLEPGATRSVSIVIAVDPASPPGRMNSVASATGDCEGGQAEVGTVAVEGRALLAEPTVTKAADRSASTVAPDAPGPTPGSPARSASAAVPERSAGGPLSRTGGLVGFGLACWALAAGLGLRLVALTVRRSPVAS